MKKYFLFLIILAISFGIISFQVVSAENSNIFYNSPEYNKIVNNKSHIVKVTRESYSEGGYEATDCDIEKAYKKVLMLKNVRKSNMAVLDADSVLIFKFDDGSSVKIHFEGQFLHYKGQNYEIVK